MKNKFFKFSLFINILCITGFVLIAIRKKDKILDIIQPDRYTIIMVGHSLTGGCDWKKELKRHDVKNDGMGGATTFNYVQAVFEDVIPRHPKICFIDGGMNDIECGIPLAKTYANYRMMVDSLIRFDIKPVLQSTLYCHHSADSITNNYVDSINIFLADLASEKGIIYINHSPLLSKNRRLNPLYTKDGYHINDAANKIWAREVNKVLENEKI